MTPEPTKTLLNPLFKEKIPFQFCFVTFNFFIQETSKTIQTFKLF